MIRSEILKEIAPICVTNSWSVTSEFRARNCMQSTISRAIFTCLGQWDLPRQLGLDWR